MAVTTQVNARMPADLVRLATERIRQDLPGVKIDSRSGVIRYAVALLAGLTRDQAASELERGYRMSDKRF